MLTDVRIRIAVAGFCCAIFLTGISSGTEAATREKPRKHIFDDLITPSMMATPETPVRQPVSTPRFFSINSVLAKLDGKPYAGEPVRVASIANDDIISDVPMLASSTSGKTEEPFGLVAFRAPEGTLWRKWRDVSRDIKTEMREVARCRADRSTCRTAAARFVLMSEDIHGHTGQNRMEIVNRLVNGSIRYMSDLAQHGTVDVWSAPLASLASGRGDCEDYAIAKYALLRDAGVSESDLRILLVRDRAIREDHAVLAVHDDGKWIVLDSRRSLLTTDRELPHFTPLFALNGSGVSLFATPYLSQRLNIDWSVVAPAADGAKAALVNDDPFSTGVSAKPSNGISYEIDALSGLASGGGTLPTLL
jgi:predicted transglutaminase-like cysteine proteinase